MEALDIPYVVVSASMVQGPAARHLIEAGYQRIFAMPLYDLH